MKSTKEKVLIVDDAPENLDVLNEILINYKRSIAINGNDAIKIANGSFKPDLILLDIMMPELDGFETCKLLKKEKKTKDIPIIFMTAMNDTLDKIKGFELGAVDYITKPIEPQELLKRVETHLEIARLQKELKNYNMVLEEKIKERTIELEKSNFDLIKAKEKAEASDKLKSEFLAQISHEIRTPLSSIMNLSGLIVDEFKDRIDDDFTDIIDGINNAGLRIIRTVELILNYSEITSGSYVFSPEKTNLNEIVSKSLEKLMYDNKHKNLECNFYAQEQFVTDSVDPHSVELIIKNIVENAFVFTNKGNIELELIRKNGDIIFECRDTGIGIGADFLKIIFDPFTQEMHGYTRKVDGNGLGLPLAKKHCELNKMEIEIESEKGAGSIFRLIFPN